MQIIPVIDLRRGIVVHAKGGDRDLYQPLRSVLTSHIHLNEVVMDLLAFYPFKIIYIADLDAIIDQQFHIEKYKNLVTQFPAVTFWIDSGVQTYEQWLDIDAVKGILPVIGSETLIDRRVLTSAKRSVLSLDFRQDVFVGESTFWQQSHLWPNKVIAMNLDHVGTQSGINLSLHDTIKRKRSDIDVIVAGGVRDVTDIALLKEHAVSAVLVASALHNGQLTLD